MVSNSKMMAPRSMRYMWTDTWCDRAARKNPLRWREFHSLADLICELTSQGKRSRRNRPLRICAQMHDGQTEREFQDVDSALDWIQNSFSLVEAEHVSDKYKRPVAKHTGCLGGFFGHSADAETLDAHEVTFAAEVATDSQEAKPLELNCTSEVAAFTDEDQTVKVPPDAMLRYMWAYAGLLPLAPIQNLAKVNPLRWSRAMPPQEVVKALEQSQLYWPDRPVKMELSAPGEHTLKTFKNVQEAISWIRDTFSIQEEASTEQEEHRCVICLDATVSVMLMPCRHAVLCDECAETMLSSTRACCPICRNPVANHAHGHFAADYVDLVEAMEAKLERTRETMYSGMYNRVRPLMLTGALLGTGAAVCFVVAPPVAPVLAGGAFAVGYVPWFATTVAHFEQEGSSAEHSTSVQRFFNEDDMRSPLRLITKVLLMTVVAPVAAIAFFVPYGIYRGVLRPLSKAVLHGLVRISAYSHVYAVRPSGSALKQLGHSILEVLRSVGGHIGDLALMLGDMLVGLGVRARELLRAVGGFLHKNTVVPCVRGAQYCGDMVVAGSRATYQHALVPAGRAVANGASAAANGIAKAATATYEHALVPLWQMLARGAAITYDYVLSPCGRFILFAIRRTGKFIAAGARGVYSYFLVPFGRVLAKALRMLANGLSSGAEMIFRHVLVPLGRGTINALRMFGRGLTAGAEFIYSNALVPVGRGLALVGKGCFSAGAVVVYGVAVASTEIYSRILVPLGGAIARGTESVYINVLAPCGRALCTAVSALAKGCKLGAQAVYAHILLPTGEVVSVVCTTAGGIIISCSTATHEAIQACVREARLACVQTCEAVQNLCAR